MSDTSKGTALVTGASTGIGAVYADRLAKRGYDLVLVARDRERLETLAARLRAETGVKVDVLAADLTDKADLAKVEDRLRTDQTLTLLVNNAGAAGQGGFADPNLDGQEWLIDLNVVAVTRLAGAVIPNFLARGSGSIINLSSVLAYAPEIMPGVYSATKAFVVTLSQSLQAELGGRGIYVQAVLPAATRTEIWDRAGLSVDALPANSVMGVDDLVDAALVGFDRREAISLPSVHNEAAWQAFDAARHTLASNFRSDRPAQRYLAAA
jgi:short-subunit dehydrogenase